VKNQTEISTLGETIVRIAFNKVVIYLAAILVFFVLQQTTIGEAKYSGVKYSSDEWKSVSVDSEGPELGVINSTNGQVEKGIFRYFAQIKKDYYISSVWLDFENKEIKIKEVRILLMNDNGEKISLERDTSYYPSLASHVATLHMEQSNFHLPNTQNIMLTVQTYDGKSFTGMVPKNIVTEMKQSYVDLLPARIDEMSKYLDSLRRMKADG
jgi:hypothetical protein